MVGIAKAKADGKYKGRKPLSKAIKEQIKVLKENGIGATEIAKILGLE